ncbi:MAG: 50S ribosomal L9 C-terminal domain-containing protein, partial [Hyphomicrobiales bacterium]
ETGFSVLRSQIQLNEPIKKIGLHEIVVALFADVNASVSVNVARSEDEAERQAMGEDVSVAEDAFADDEEEEEVAVDEDAPDLDEVFEEGAGENADEDDASDEDKTD